jgi:hypothetical protein
MENSISAMETKISAGQEEMKDIHDKISTGQAEFEERMTDLLDRQVKGVITMVD